MFDQGEHTYKSDLLLGARYRDKGTGIEGNLTSIHFYEHACERGNLRYVDRDGNVQEASFDAPELLRVDVEPPAPVRQQRTGGPSRAVGARVSPSRGAAGRG